MFGDDRAGFGEVWFGYDVRGVRDARGVRGMISMFCSASAI